MLLSLYLTFLKVGAFAFGGGYATIPLIQHYVVEQEGWLSYGEFTDLIAISQMTPGPIAINSATFVGTKIAGLPGSIVATLGCVTPQLILMLVLGYFLFSKKKKFLFLDNFIRGVRPVVIGLILTAALSTFRSAILVPHGSLPLEPVALLSFVVVAILMMKKVDVMKLIVVGAAIGLLCTPLLGMVLPTA